MKILIIGLGSIAQKHIAAILKLYPASVFYALRSNTNLKNFSNVHNIFNLNDTPKDIDFVLISNPTSLHASSIEKTLFLKKPIFIEKPLFDKIEINTDLKNIVNKSNIKTYIACNLRFHPSILFLKDYLSKKDKKINEVNIYCGSFLPHWRGNTNYTESYSALKDMGGGVHLDLIHELDYAIWLFGFPLNYHSTKRKISQLKINSFDYCSYDLQYREFNMSIILNYYRVSTKREIEILFEDDILHCNLLNSEIRNNNNDLLFVDKTFDISKTYLSQAEYFINNLNNNLPYMNNFNESFEILKIALHG